MTHLSTPAATDPAATARETLDRATRRLLDLQLPSGAWKGELETNVTMDAEDMMLRVFLGIDTAETRDRTARWIRSQQRADGTWATFAGGPGDLSTTVEAWIALRMAGDKPTAEHMVAAREFVLTAGGLEQTRVFTRIWCALFGWWDWSELPAMPPELMYLGKHVPLNIYDWGCWARQTIVPLTVVCTLRPKRRMKWDLAELLTGTTPKSQRGGVPGAFNKLDKGLHLYHRHAIGPVRRNALRRAAEWIIARQEADGGWGGIQPPWVYSILALHALGYPLDHPVLRAGIDGLEGFVISEDTADGPVRRLEACQSPVWDTGLALNALLDAGVDPRDPALRRAADWLMAEQITVPGDWTEQRPKLPPGGWAFEYANDNYPDTDDSAIIVMGLRRVITTHGPVQEQAVSRGIAWTAGMQSKDGGWGAFDADNTSGWPAQLPFCDFGAVTDPPSADVTAHVVEMLAAVGRSRGARCQRGVQWLLDHQETDGSWFGRWGANHVYGTGAVVPALVAAGVSPKAGSIRAAVRWLEAHQNPDGGWGEDLRSYDDPAWIGRGDSTPSQTAWALMALVAAGELGTSLTRGVDYLANTQQSEGGWAEDRFTGTGFPGDFYIAYHLYRLIFPVWALGRAVQALHGGDRGDPTPRSSRPLRSSDTSRGPRVLLEVSEVATRESDQ
ncbi:squalene-hopene cyclase [Flexivirga endophytica]|uniref:Squalene-hopene cyclase n=1 Tax=Flexivirga endophytica TaxID=1849103 RepID=A0A916T0D5_9MICO|nr:squalene--hopene cyclase [Flexivirga endophytica]GGB22884.1 squalene-hopene cyclase [Flexivirga endophytica]GHB56818.1 squalene-hopene cyclase [Flexivirga endophytica]